MTESALTERHCQREVEKLAAEQIHELAPALDTDWAIDENSGEIQRVFTFKNYYQTIAFVNALAWITHREDHHPDLEVSYNRCVVHYSTHSVGGLSENDFICAAKLDALAAA